MVKKIFKNKKKQEVKTYEKYQKERSIRRSEGDRWVYYIFHSFFTALFFIVIAIYFDFFAMKSELVTDLFTWGFFMAIIWVFIVSIGANLVARVFAWFLIRGIYRNTASKNIWELNSTGINKIGIRYIIAIFITSLIFCIGAVVIIQEKIFGTTEDEIVSLIVIYLVIKIFVFITTKVLIGAKG